MTKILIINGPNLNMLDQRDKKIYGDSSIAKIEENCRNNAKKILVLMLIFFKVILKEE